MSDKATKRWRRFGLALLALVAIQLTLDGLYAGYVAFSASRWEASVQRDAAGVLAGCGAFDLPAGGDEPTDTAILLVHGINASPRHYDMVAPELAERGYKIRAMRLPGFGESLDKYAETTSQQWVEAVATELANLRKDHNRVGLVGHSLGGAVSIQTLIADPTAADFAVLIAPAVAVSDSRSPLVSTRAWHNFARRVLVFTRTLSSPFAMDCHDPSRHDHPGGVPFTPIAVVEELFQLMDRNQAGAKQLTTPVTMVLSADDRVVNTAAAEAYFQQIGSTDKRLVQLTNSGHEIPLDYEWPAVVEAIDQLAQEEELAHEGVDSPGS